MKSMPVLLHRLGFTMEQVHGAKLQTHTKIGEACHRILDMPFAKDSMYLGHSGGKDSVLVAALAYLALGYMPPVVHTPKPTGVKNAVHPLTRDFLYSLPFPVIYQPLVEDESAMQVQSIYKFKTQIDGTRAAEASRRDGRDVGLIVNGVEKSRTETPLYLENGLFNRNFVYPIFDWSDLEVWTAILMHDIPFSAEYYELPEDTYDLS